MEVPLLSVTHAGAERPSHLGCSSAPLQYCCQTLMELPAREACCYPLPDAAARLTAGVLQ